MEANRQSRTGRLRRPENCGKRFTSRDFVLSRFIHELGAPSENVNENWSLILNEKQEYDSPVFPNFRAEQKVDRNRIR